MILFDVAVVQPPEGMNPSYLWRHSGRSVFAISVLGMAYCCYFGRTNRVIFDKLFLQARDDLKDPVQTYGLRPSLNDVGFEPRGPAGFWIADEDGEIVGYVGLSQ
jgi:hypothetical protein